MPTIFDFDKITNMNDLKKALRFLEQKLLDSNQDNERLKTDIKGLKTMLGQNDVARKYGDWDIEKKKDFGAFFAYIYGSRKDEVVNRVEKADWGTPLVGNSGTSAYTVPEEYVADIYKVLDTESELWPLVTRVPQISNSAKYPKMGTGFSFTRVGDETDDLTEQNPTFSELDLDVQDFAGVIPVSENFIDDNLVIVANYFRSLIEDGLIISVETNFLNNASNPTGLLQNTSVNSSIMTDTGFADLEGDDLMLLVEDLTTKRKRRGAHFFMHPTIVDVISKMKNANGDYIFREATEMMKARVHGYPIVQSDSMPELADSASNTAFVGFGAPKHLIYGNRKPLEFRVFDQTSYAATNREVFFRAVYRASFVNAYEAGFSILKTAS